MFAFKVDMSPVSQPPEPTAFVKTEAYISCVRITILVAYQNKQTNK